MCVLVASGAHAQTNDTQLDAPLSLWDVSARMTLGGGYRDNVALSSLASESSSFVEASADFSAIRISDEGAILSLFVLGELRRYLDSEDVRNEDILYTSLQYERPAGTKSRLGGEFQYFYENQVLDVTETETQVQRVLVRGHGLSAKPLWQYSPTADWQVTLEGIARRQFYEAQLDDYWEGIGRLTLKRSYGNRCFVSVSYQIRDRFYDTREQYDGEGVPIPDTDLVYRYHEVGGEWRHYWDENRRWRTTLKAGYLVNNDNGTGYFNYEAVRTAFQLRWHQGGWDTKFDARAGWYAYPSQDIAGERRERSSYALELRAERMLDRHWLLYAVASREWHFSNEPLDQYSDWIASAGLGVDF